MSRLAYKAVILNSTHHSQIEEHQIVQSLFLVLWVTPASQAAKSPSYELFDGAGSAKIEVVL